MTVTIPARMRQISFDGKGGPEVIRVGEGVVPMPGPGKVLLEVHAAGINRPDIIQRAGFYPPPPGESDIPGLEVSGTIVKLGDGVTQWSVGDEVCALLGSGGYAEYAVADAALCLPVPKALSLIEAAALPETYFTVYDNVFRRGGLRHGETFLVHGGSSGIGTTAIQLAKQFGATVFTTAGSAEKCAFCKTLGADHAIDYKTSDFAEEIRKITDAKHPIDVILDMVGGDYIAKNLSLLNFDGRMVQIAFLQSPKVASFDFLPLMLRRLTMTGSTLRARALGQKIDIAMGLRQLIWPLLDEGTVKPIVHATFPLEETRQAHELMESSAHLGKILLLTGRS